MVLVGPICIYRRETFQQPRLPDLDDVNPGSALPNRDVIGQIIRVLGDTPSHCDSTPGAAPVRYPSLLGMPARPQCRLGLYVKVHYAGAWR